MIKVLVPDMPSTEELLPYLHQIDESHTYSNSGPLVGGLQAILEKKMGVPCVAVDNGTHAIELALKALLVPPHSNVLVPAMTFRATGQAIRAAGMNPILCDVSMDTWQIDPSSCARLLKEMNIQIVMPVATFGYPVDAEAWSQFAEEHRVFVVIDAAGALGTQKIPNNSRLSVAFSMHATKFIGAGEGGIIASSNLDQLKRAQSLSLFGNCGGNYKMSEYHAAVALASLERLPKKRRKSELVSKFYEDHLPKNLMIGPTSQTKTDLTVAVLALPQSSVFGFCYKKNPLGTEIETRRWYRPFLDELFEFNGAARADLLINTHALRGRLLGIPFHNYLSEQDVIKVCDELRFAVSRQEEK